MRSAGRLGVQPEHWPADKEGRHKYHSEAQDAEYFTLLNAVALRPDVLRSGSVMQTGSLIPSPSDSTAVAVKVGELHNWRAA